MTYLIPKAPSIDLMRRLGLEPDPWQIEVLESSEPRLLLNCCRQAGKSTVVGMLALTEALWKPGTLVLIVSPSLRQSTELYRIIIGFYERMNTPFRARQTKGELTLKNGSRIVCLPCKEATIRGYSNVALLIVDEASRVPDDILLAVSPMLAVSRGRIICLSTPRGKRGFFYEAWARQGADWQRFEIPATRVPRIAADFLEQQQRTMSETTFRQEYCCSFEVLEGLVYPQLASCVVTCAAPQEFKQRLGGMDFGYRNPFAAVWGGLDHDDTLWLTHEHYQRQQPLSYHAARLPRDVVWSADPASPGDHAELRKAGFKIFAAPNAVRAGIAAVQARIATGRLKIVAGQCPHLLAEAGLYRYDDAAEHGSEQPVGEYDHALDALRYLIARLDHHRQAQPLAPGNPPKPPPRPKPKVGCDFNDPEIWTTLGTIGRF